MPGAVRPTWLIEADVFGEAADPLKAQVRRQGMEWRVVRQRAAAVGAPGRGDIIGAEDLGDGACVVFYGSLPLLLHIQLHRRWRPGGWGSAGNFACSAYYPHFKKYLLNGRSAILPAAEAVGRREELFETYAVDGGVFVRPDGMEKSFTGRRAGRDDFAGALGAAKYDPAARVVVAGARAIGREWRLVVAGGGVAAASQYADRLADRGPRDLAAGCPADVEAFAREILADVRWRPDPIFMLDVCESQGDLFLLELNSFSCSGLYLCDPAAVVSAASALAAAL